MGIALCPYKQLTLQQKKQEYPLIEWFVPRNDRLVSTLKVAPHH